MNQHTKGHTWKADEYSIEAPPGTSPRIPADHRKIKSLETKDPSQVLPLSLFSLGRRAVPFSLRCVSVYTFLYTLRVPRRLATRGAVGSGGSSQVIPLHLSPRPPFL